MYETIKHWSHALKLRVAENNQKAKNVQIMVKVLMIKKVTLLYTIYFLRIRLCLCWALVNVYLIRPLIWHFMTFLKQHFFIHLQKN
jgi:hypothetical protein